MSEDRGNTQLKDRRMRVMWNSNGVTTNSGYGAYQRDLLFRMARDGWPTSQIAFWGINGYPITVHGEDVIDDRFKDVTIKLFPKMVDDFGSDAMYYHAKEWKANAVFAMLDVWTLNPEFLVRLSNENIPFVPYVPIDKDPVPPGVLDRLRYANKIVSFSRFGQKTLENAGFASTLILEGTDTENFKPLDREFCRKELRVPQDAFLFGMVAANKENPPRKGFQEALEAFKRFQDKHKEAAIMIHTQQPGPMGFPVVPFARQIGIDMSRFFTMDEYKAVYNSDFRVVRQEMNAMDVLLHPSHTEGFGLTVIEAASCGTPSIVNNTTSMPEMIVDGVTGEICKTMGRKRYTNDLSFVEPANPDSIYDKMESLYKKLKTDPDKVRKACRKHIIDNYNIDTQYKELWIPFLERLQNKTLGPLPQTDSV